MAPILPKEYFQRLPPILRKKSSNSIPRHSKASQGLFVQVKVVRIFTDNLISPSLSLRQYPDRYSFRAGRNLPDKEFRYLRIVIVTTAVHQGFGCQLCRNEPTSLTFQHWAGVSPHTLSCDFAETYVFGKQSPGSIHCDVQCTYPLSRSYGVILPSSLERVISRSLVYSTHPPVSVYGTALSFSQSYVLFLEIQ